MPLATNGQFVEPAETLINIYVCMWNTELRISAGVGTQSHAKY